MNATAEAAKRENIMTTTLRNGIEVTAKMYHGEPSALTYANRTQAARIAERMGEGWDVYHFGNPFYVGRVREAAEDAYDAG